MDKSVLPQAAIYGLIEDLGLVKQDYSWCSSLFYFGYLAFQPLGVLCLTKLRPGKFVISITILWAMTLIATTAATNFTGMVCDFGVKCQVVESISYDPSADKPSRPFAGSY